MRHLRLRNAENFGGKFHDHAPKTVGHLCGGAEAPISKRRYVFKLHARRRLARCLQIQRTSARPGWQLCEQATLIFQARGGGAMAPIGPRQKSRPAASGSAFWGEPVAAATCSARPPLTLTGVRQESWQRIGGESPPRERSSQPPRPRVMHEVLLARAAVKRSQGRPRAEY